MFATPTAIAAGSTAHVRVTYAKVTRAPRLPHDARRLGATSSSATVSGIVAIRPRNPQALQAAATAVATPHSTSYHQYLSKGAFAAKYGPTASTVAAVRSALTASHLSVTSVSGNHLLVHFRGTVGAAESAFRTRIANYRLANGDTGRATTTAVKLPSSIASQVDGVVGLNTLGSWSTSLKHATHPAAVKAKAPAHPLASVADGPHACKAASEMADQLGGLTDEQIANAYGLTGLYQNGDTGTGQHVALFELEPYSQTDLKTFDTCYFGSTAAASMLARTQVVPVDGGTGSGPGEGEAILDIENIQALAPGANVDVYEGPNSNAGVVDTYAAIINSDIDSVISTSWGECEADLKVLDPGAFNIENDLFEQAALQGQTTYSATGDSGSDDCAEESLTPAAPDLSTDDPSGQPFVTAVGGTTISNATNPPTERPWNDGNVGGGNGGGVSSVWGAPAWQTAADNADASAVTQAVHDGLVQCANAADGGLCRQLPDVTADADEYTGGITLYFTGFGGWSTLGGTSSAAPLWAAITADINASASCASTGQPHQGVGFISPELYAIAAVPSEYAASFNDIKTGNNDVYDLSAGKDYRAGTGYDMASGLGSPIVTQSGGQAGLASYLCAMAGGAAQQPTVSSVSPSVEAVTPTDPKLVITGTNLTGATGVSVGGYQVPATDIDVVSGTEIDVTPIPSGVQAASGGVGPQAGGGRYLVSVTGANGVSSMLNASASVLYVRTQTGNNVPAVSGISPYALPMTTAGTKQVTVYGSDFSNDGAVTATVGGVNATVTPVSDTEIKVTIPAYSSLNTACETSISLTNDGCQTELVVSNTNGDSNSDPIVKPFTGAPYEGSSSGAPVPDCVTDASCEVAPANSEFDYLVAPTITSFAPSYVSEDPDFPSIGTIHGSGFDFLGLEWVNVGSASLDASQVSELVSVTPTEIQFTVPGTSGPSKLPVTRKLSVAAQQGLSNISVLTYAGVPKLTTVSPQAGPDTGGTHFTLTGTGFDGVSRADGGSIAYMYVDFGIASTQLSGYTANSAGTQITGTTPAINPGQFVVEVCTVTLCSEPPASQKGFDASTFDFFDSGDPVVTGLSSSSGPASGGSKVVITGQNLSDVTSVKFGSATAEATNAEEILTNGSNSEIDAIAPPGKAGSTVDVVVSTMESTHGGHPSAKSKVDHFTYQRSHPAPPQDVKVTPHGQSPTIHWKAPASTGGSKILRYRVIAHALKDSDKKGAKSPKNVVVVTKNAKARHAKMRKLKAGWFYVFFVRAVNKKGVGLEGTNGNEYLIKQPAK